MNHLEILGVRPWEMSGFLEVEIAAMTTLIGRYRKAATEAERERKKRGS